jgi:hypothetical protein
VSHAHAALTSRARLRLAELVVDRGRTNAAAAKVFIVAPRTAKKGLMTSPARSSPELVRRLGLQASTVHAVLVPHRPQTDSKIERLHRTLADGRAYARLYGSTEQRSAALPT